MCVSSSFCEKNLQLLFSLLSSRRREDRFEGSQRLRANIIVAVGDLAFRFPNLLEPWTKHIYRPLSVRPTPSRIDAYRETT
jgi:condensin complex subunit 1